MLFDSYNNIHLMIVISIIIIPLLINSILYSILIYLDKRKEFMKVGITFSTFDLFHAGHVKMVEEAKRQCDYLIVGLQLDPSIDRPEKNEPSQSIIERYIQLKGSKHVDEIVPYVSEQDLEDILRSFKLDVRIIGNEYKEKNL